MMVMGIGEWQTGCAPRKCFFIADSAWISGGEGVFSGD